MNSMIDSHCHLADETFAADLEDVVRRAQDAGLERALVILEAGNAKEAAQAERAARRSGPRSRFAIGVHPHQAHQFADDPERAGDRRPRAVRRDAGGARGRRDRPRLPLRLLAARRAARGVPRADPRSRCELDRPVVIHTREADEDTVAILREEGEGRAARRPALFHR